MQVGGRHLDGLHVAEAEGVVHIPAVLVHLVRCGHLQHRVAIARLPDHGKQPLLRRGRAVLADLAPLALLHELGCGREPA